MVQNNTTSEYKKTYEQSVQTTNKKAAIIANSLGLDDRIDQYIQSEAYITIKDHKPSWPTRPESRLINPAKPEIGKISKQLLTNIVKEIKKIKNYNQWSSSQEAIEWFKNLEHKESLIFIKYDITAFYPSITKKIFEDSLHWAKSIINIPEDDINIILHSRESYLFFNNKPWIRKNRENFDVTMGSFDGAECSELTGLFLLSKLESIFKPGSNGLYRDDGLAAVNMSGPQVEKTRKEMFALFKNIGLGLTIEGNIKKTDFLDIWFDLQSGTYQPYRKPNDQPIYVHKESNHPPIILREIPSMISKRLSGLSSSEEMFQKEAQLYNNALLNAGYKEKVKYYKEETCTKKKTSRNRTVTWYNPPFSINVKTNVGKKFLNLVDKHFKNTELGKHFNRSTIKISYCTMGNINTIISSHNKKIMKDLQDEEEPKPTNKKKCNCRARNGIIECPLNGECVDAVSVVYEAELTSDKPEDTCYYIGQTANNFKERLSDHRKDFKNERYRKATSLSKQVWKYKEKSKPVNIKWKIKTKASAYNPASKVCRLCLMEKTMILYSEHQNLLNRRSEIIGMCRHRYNHLLSAFIKPPRGRPRLQPPD